MDPLTMEIPEPLERVGDESHNMDFPVGENVGKNVVLCVLKGEVRGAALVKDGQVIEYWEPDAAIKSDSRTQLGLTQVSPITAQVVRIFHKPNEPPHLMIGVRI